MLLRPPPPCMSCFAATTSSYQPQSLSWLLPPPSAFYRNTIHHCKPRSWDSSLNNVFSRAGGCWSWEGSWWCWRCCVVWHNPHAPRRLLPAPGFQAVKDRAVCLLGCSLRRFGFSLSYRSDLLILKCQQWAIKMNNVIMEWFFWWIEARRKSLNCYHAVFLDSCWKLESL